MNAIYFAAMRAANAGTGIEFLSGISPDEFNLRISVRSMMREEPRTRIHAHFEVFAKWMRDRHAINPELVIREGEPIPEILVHVQDDPEIGVVVLGAGKGKKGPGPLVAQLT